MTELTKKTTGFLAEFRQFIARGNVLDMAVGVIIGGAFGKISTSLVNDILMPLLSLLTGGADFSQWQWVLREAVYDAGGNEVPLEVWYGWQVTGWMNLKFDAQYVINPGGRGFNAAGVKTDNAVVLGMRTEVHF